MEEIYPKGKVMDQNVNIDVKEVDGASLTPDVPRMLVDDLFNFQGNRKQRREKMREIKRMFKKESTFSTLLTEAMKRGYVKEDSTDA